MGAAVNLFLLYKLHCIECNWTLEVICPFYASAAHTMKRKDMDTSDLALNGMAAVAGGVVFGRNYGFWSFP